MKQFTSQIATSEEQSKRLLKLGLIPITANMYYWIDSYDVSYNHELNIIVNDEIEWGEGFIPAWSLSRLIELIPKKINYKYDTYHLTINMYNNDLFYIKYDRYDKHLDCLVDDGDLLEEIEGCNIIDCCIDIIEWLINSNHFDKKMLNDGAQ